jgi:hypothetical protein
VKSVLDSEHTGGRGTARQRGGTSGASVAIVVVWLALGWVWLVLVAGFVGAFSELAAGGWAIAGAMLAAAVLWWMVRARGSPSRVGALACWWAGACVVAPFALLFLLPWARPFRERSLKWTERILGRKPAAANPGAARRYVDTAPRTAPSALPPGLPEVDEAVPEHARADERPEVDRRRTNVTVLVLGGGALLYLFVPLQIISDGFVLTSTCLTDDTARFLTACAIAGLIAGVAVLVVGLLDGWRWWLSVLAGIAAVVPAGAVFLLLVGLSGGGGDCPAGDGAELGSAFLLSLTRLPGRLAD